MPVTEQVPRPPAPRSPSYRLYVDESGDHTYSKLDRPGHSHLGLLGVWFEQKTVYPAFAAALERIKGEFFRGTPDEPVLLHRKELVNRKGCFGVLCDPAVCKRFDDALLRLVNDSDFTMVCAIIDKKHHQQQYVRPFDPYHWSLACMLERYCRWLNERGEQGDVWAEQRGAKENRVLEAAYRRMWEEGEGYLKASMAQRALTSREIKLSSKDRNIAGLQLADLLAHPLKLEAMIERGVLKDPGPYFGRELAQVAAKKYRRYGSRIAGFGLVWC